MKDPLARVKRAARKAALSHEQLAAEIRNARSQGETLRAIAASSDMSYETVRRICEK